ncbi:MAG: hypothetical protein NUV73_01195 [Candidatus Daviesbacteria bacterium]|nr:hypothetical protein [Candidatus Daviesbacteria bacterium]
MNLEFDQTIEKIRKVVWERGYTPASYKGSLIRFLESTSELSEGYRAEDYLQELSDPYLILVKRGQPTRGIAALNYDHLEITYRPEGKTSLRLNTPEYPEALEFERPESLPPGNLFMIRGNSLFFWLEQNLLGPKTLNFLEKQAAQALSEFSK